MTFAPPPHPSSVDQPTSAQAATPRRPQLQRSHTDTMLGGVCGGLAEYSGIETLLWRIGFVAAALLGPGVLVYLLLWVLMPPAPEVPAAELGSLDRIVGDLHRRVTGRRAAPPPA